MLERVARVEGLDKTVVATTLAERDNAIAAFCEKNGVECFRGSENDVLDRYFQAAVSWKADIVVRLTADCPLIDPNVVGKIIRAFLEKCPDIDFAGNVKPPTYPDGMDTEVFSMNALRRAWTETTKPLDREHVTPYFYDEPGRFRTLNVTAARDYSRYRLTVDHDADFRAVERIFLDLYRPESIFTFEEIVAYLDEHPDVLALNQSFNRNPWYVQYQKQKENK
jgi:spore coat polysaccharide biosynthesis protein SpsF